MGWTIHTLGRLKSEFCTLAACHNKATLDLYKFKIHNSKVNHNCLYKGRGYIREKEIEQIEHFHEESRILLGEEGLIVNLLHGINPIKKSRA